MPWLTDPSITSQMSQPPNPLEAYMRFAQLKQMGQQGQFEKLRLSQLTKQQQDQEQLEGAYGGAFQPGANGVPQLDQGALLRNLVKVNPAAAAQVSAQLNAQAQTQRTQGLEEQSKRLDVLGKQADLLTQGAQYGLSLPPEQRPKGIQDYLGNLVQQGAINPQQAQQTLQSLPLNDPQALETALHGHLMTGLKIKDQLEMQRQQQVDIETERNHRAMEAKQPVTESELALKAAQGDAVSEKALLRLDKSKLASRPININKPNADLKAQAIETAAQSVAHGELTRLRDMAGMRGEDRLLIFNRAKQLNPQLNLSEIDRKIKMEDDLSNGKLGQNVQSFGTFLEHAGEASDMVNNYRATNMKFINTTVNKLRDQFGDAAYTQYTAALEPVRQEAASFLKNGHATLAEDRVAADKILSDNATPAQQQAAIKQLGHTVKARYNEANFRYKRTMGHDMEDVLSPEALQGAQKIGINMGAASLNSPGLNQKMGGQKTPTAGAIEGGYRFKGGDPADQKNWEKQ